MPDSKNNIYLYEAIELRAEYDARIQTLKSLLPEARQNRDRLSFRGDGEVRHRPVAAFSVDAVREELSKLAVKKRKLNNAIQRANFDNKITVNGQEMNLAEALELRKAVNEQIGEANTQLVASAYERVIYKEGRDIVEGPEVEYAKAVKALEEKRLLFRELNRKLRAAAYEIAIDFKDEK
jgi:hypothetical protein